MAEAATPPAPLGTTALRNTVAAARAVAGAADRIAPAPPPDAAETPWASHREPRPTTQADERRKKVIDEASNPNPTPKARKPKKVEPPPLDTQVSQLVETVLIEWTKNVEKKNI